MKHYVYKDNAKGKYEPGYSWVAPIVFEVDAENILEADKAFEEHTGKDPAKLPHIGCSIKDIA